MILSKKINCSNPHISTINKALASSPLIILTPLCCRHHFPPSSPQNWYHPRLHRPCHCFPSLTITGSPTIVCTWLPFAWPLILVHHLAYSLTPTHCYWQPLIHIHPCQLTIIPIATTTITFLPQLILLLGIS